MAQGQTRDHQNLYQLASHQPCLDHTEEVSFHEAYRDPLEHHIHDHVVDHPCDQYLDYNGDLQPYGVQEKQNLHGFYILDIKASDF